MSKARARLSEVPEKGKVCLARSCTQCLTSGSQVHDRPEVANSIFASWAPARQARSLRRKGMLEALNCRDRRPCIFCSVLDRDSVRHDFGLGEPSCAALFR